MKLRLRRVVWYCSLTERIAKKPSAARLLSPELSAGNRNLRRPSRSTVKKSEPCWTKPVLRPSPSGGVAEEESQRILNQARRDAEKEAENIIGKGLMESRKILEDTETTDSLLRDLLSLVLPPLEGGEK